MAAKQSPFYEVIVHEGIKTVLFKKDFIMNLISF